MPFKTYADLEYLHKATALLTTCRARDPLAGLWDLGDLHWWWRSDLYDNPSQQRFWEGRDGPLGMLLLSEHHATFNYEIMPGFEDYADARALFSEGLAWLERFELLDTPVRPSFYVRSTHGVFQTLAREAGFYDSGHSRVQSYQRLATRPATVPLPAGFSVRPLADADLLRGCSPVLPLSAASLARVRRTPSYRPELHLVVVAREGEVAAECICWWDEENGIGVIEPLEIARAFMRRGLAKGFIARGLSLLAEREVRLVKISYNKRHQAAGKLGASLGFKPSGERKLFVGHR